MNNALESWPKLEGIVASWLESYRSDAAGAVVPIYNAFDEVVDCINSLGETTPKEVPVLLIDDASSDKDLPDAVSSLADKYGFCYIRKPQNSGFVNTINLAFAWFQPRDVVIINSDTIFPVNWYSRLRNAAYCRGHVATATPLTNHGTIATVPNWHQPSPDLIEGMTLTETDGRIEDSSLKLYPAVPTAVGHCIYFRRTALDAVGFFDHSFSPGYGEEVDFSQRAILAGFENVIADDLFIHHKHNRSFSQLGRLATAKLQDQHHPILTQRYPNYYSEIQRLRQSSDSPFMQAMTQARRALLGPDAAPLVDVPDVKPAPKSFTQQLRRSFEILQQDGISGLRAEIEQYVRWQRHR